MRTLAVPIEFRQSVNGLIPVDNDLYSAAMKFCKEELAEQITLTDYAKVWVCAKFDDAGKVVKVTGIQTLWQVVDLPVSRYTDSKSAKLLSERVDSYLADQGMRGKYIFVYISGSEKPEQRCKNYLDWLRIWKAKPAERMIVRVR